MSRGFVPTIVGVQDNPNFKRYKNTNYYFSKMGDVVRIDSQGKEHIVTPTRIKKRGMVCVNTHDGVVSVGRTIYDLHIGLKNPKNVVIHKNGIITDNSLSNLQEVSRNTSSKKNAGRKPRPVYDKKEKIVYRSAQHYADEKFYALKTVYKFLRHKQNNLMYITEEEAMEL